METLIFQTNRKRLQIHLPILIQYWTNNGGYRSIQNKVAKAKVFYGSHWKWENTIYGFRWVNQKDHSAIVDSNTNYFISKWGRLPLYRHKPADCPYTEYGLNLSYYYLDEPIISDTVSAALCTNVQRTYSSDIVTTDFTYNWNCTSPLDEVSDDNGNEYIVKGTSQNGEGTVSLTVTSPSGATTTASKNVYVGKPDPDDIDVINVGPNYPGSMVLCEDMPNDGKVN